MIRELPNGLSGEVVSFRTKGCTATIDQIRKALIDEGFDPSFALDKMPKTAFRQALRQMGTNRVVKEVKTEDSGFTFQVTREFFEESGEEWCYSKEDKYTLDIETGKISGENAPQSIVDALENMYLQMLPKRDRRSIINLLFRLFRSQADIWCINEENGGTYLIPFDSQDKREFIDRIERVLNNVGGTVVRIPVQKGDERADQEVKHVVERGLRDMVSDLRNEIASDWGDTTRRCTWERAARQFNEYKMKASAYSQLLQDKSVELEQEIEQATKEMKKKVNTILAAKAAAKAG